MGSLAGPRSRSKEPASIDKQTGGDMTHRANETDSRTYWPAGVAMNVRRHGINHVYSVHLCRFCRPTRVPADDSLCDTAWQARIQKESYQRVTTDRDREREREREMADSHRTPSVTHTHPHADTPCILFLRGGSSCFD